MYRCKSPKHLKLRGYKIKAQTDRPIRNKHFKLYQQNKNALKLYFSAKPFQTENNQITFSEINFRLKNTVKFLYYILVH